MVQLCPPHPHPHFSSICFLGSWVPPPAPSSPRTRLRITLCTVLGPSAKFLSLVTPKQRELGNGGCQPWKRDLSTCLAWCLLSCVHSFTHSFLLFHICPRSGPGPVPAGAPRRCPPPSWLTSPAISPLWGCPAAPGVSHCSGCVPLLWGCPTAPGVSRCSRGVLLHPSRALRSPQVR